MHLIDQTPFEFFRQESLNNDPVVRVQAMSNLGAICAVISAEAIKNELIPYLLSRDIYYLISYY